MTTIVPRADERWLASSLPVRRASATMVLVALGSLGLHVVFVGATAVAARTPAPPPQEISVEIVREVPKPAVKAPEPVKVAKAEPAKVEPERTRVEPPKPAPVKAEAAKTEPLKTEPTKAEPPKPEPARPTRTRQAAAKPPPPAREADAERKLAQLQDELSRLRQEQAQLRAEREIAAAPQPAALQDTGMGALPDTFQSIALPSTTEGQGEAASYQAIVFSALAKAKGIGGVMGLPGSAGVRFTVDATGKLVQVELVHRSGVPSLDALALDIVRRAAPFPPPPQGAQRDFAANFNFETRSAR